MNNTPKIAVLSLSKPWIFAGIEALPHYSREEKESALTPEKEVWLKQMWTLRDEISLDVLYILEHGLPKPGMYDGYIIWGSRYMVSEELPWMKELQAFLHQEINAGKYGFGVCFWHQTLAKAFWGKVEYAPIQKFWWGGVTLNQDGTQNPLFAESNPDFSAYWSHKQFVSDTWEATALGENDHTPNQIITLWDRAWGVQFHPEFSKNFMTFLTRYTWDSLVTDGMKPRDKMREIIWHEEAEAGKLLSSFAKQILQDT